MARESILAQLARSLLGIKRKVENVVGQSDSPAWGLGPGSPDGGASQPQRDPWEHKRGTCRGLVCHMGCGPRRLFVLVARAEKKRTGGAEGSVCPDPGQTLVGISRGGDPMTISQMLVFKKTLRATPEDIFRAFTNSLHLRMWLCDQGILEARKGGRLYLAWSGGYYVVGEFTTFLPPRRLELRWMGRGEPGPSRVRLSLVPRGGETSLTLTHEDIGRGPAWRATLRQLDRGWQRALLSLASLVEDGTDLRLARRPLIGISFAEEVTAERARTRGLPPTGGVELICVVDGMALERGGLRKGDVILGLGRRKVTDWRSLAAALDRYQAGDRVKVVFQRNGERKSAEVELSERRLPEIPWDPKELAKRMSSVYGQADAELRKALEGISEAQSERAPHPGEWSPKEVLAHLTLSEREIHSWIAGLLAGEECETVFHSNNTLRLDATVAVYVSIRALLDELWRNQAETVALLDSLPDEFVADKGLYWRLARLLAESQDHFRDHIRQIEQSLALFQVTETGKGKTKEMR